MTDTHTEGVFKDREEEFRALQKAHAGLKGSYRKAQQTLTLKDHIIKTREFERDEARRECAELAFSDEEELTGEIIARNLRDGGQHSFMAHNAFPSFHVDSVMTGERIHCITPVDLDTVASAIENREHHD